jgi:hypothetical protein
VDYNILTSILIDPVKRNYWIKPVGIPEQEADLNQRFTESRLRIDFAHSPDEIRVGDVLIVYRIKITKLIYIAICETGVMKATSSEMIEQPWKQRWSYYINGINITPTYGGQWVQHELKPFELVKAFNLNYPDQKQNINTIKWGNDKKQISEEFAHYIMRKIRLL